MKNYYLKVIFGMVIFLFAVALGYFVASYVRTQNLFDYWGMIAIFAGLYILFGIIVSAVSAISLGFLFAADVLLINLLNQYYGQWSDVFKVAIIGSILVLMYIVSWMKLKDKTEIPLITQ